MNMRYHDITKNDMMNGEGLRVCLWLSGCDHHCKDCQNPITWNPDDGLIFDDKAKEEIIEQLTEEHISGITLTGGDPLHGNNLKGVYELISFIKRYFKDKSIWLYTGYTFEEIMKKPKTIKGFILGEKTFSQEASIRREIVSLVDILVDGRFEKELFDPKYPWAGSTNQRVIDVQESIKRGTIVLWKQTNSNL